LVEKEGSSNHASSPSSSESPQAELRHSTEDTLIENEGGCLSSVNRDMISRSRRSSVASSLSSSVPQSSEDEDDNPMDIVEQKSTGDSSEEEGQGSEGDGEGEAMTGIEGTKLPLDSLEYDEREAMDVDGDSSVELAAPLQPRRSLRNAGLKSKPRPESVVPQTPTTKRKGPPTMKLLMLEVCIQNF
jgi:hypothetical protein